MNFNCSVIPNFHKERKKNQKTFSALQSDQVVLCCQKKKNCLIDIPGDYFKWTVGKNSFHLISNIVVS